MAQVCFGPRVGANEFHQRRLAGSSFAIHPEYPAWTFQPGHKVVVGLLIYPFESLSMSWENFFLALIDRIKQKALKESWTSLASKSKRFN